MADNSKVDISVSRGDVTVRCTDCPEYLIYWGKKINLAEVNFMVKGHNDRRHPKEK